MHFISFLILGVAVSALAKATLPGRLGSGWLPAIGFGVVGGILGSMVLSWIFGMLFSPKIWFVALVVGLVALGWRAIKGRSSSKRQPTA